MPTSCHLNVANFSSDSNLELQNFTCIEMTPTFWSHPWFITTNPVYFSFCRILVYFDVFDYFGLYFIHFNDKYFRLNSRSEIRPTTPGQSNSNRSNIWELHLNMVTTGRTQFPQNTLSGHFFSKIAMNKIPIILFCVDWP